VKTRDKEKNVQEGGVGGERFWFLCGAKVKVFEPREKEVKRFPLREKKNGSIGRGKGGVVRWGQKFCYKTNENGV